jgi:hypothetical protein
MQNAECTMQNGEFSEEQQRTEGGGMAPFGTFWHLLALFGTAFSARAGREEHTEVNRRDAELKS